jgi:hypothetical protein
MLWLFKKKILQSGGKLEKAIQNGGNKRCARDTFLLQFIDF